MANAKIYDADGSIINVEYRDSDTNRVRIGSDWYEQGAMTNDGRIIAFDNMPDGWARQIGDYKTPDHEFYPKAETQSFYPNSWSYAKEHSEEELYFNSYSQNVDCRNAIDDAIRNSYDPVFGSLSKDAAKNVVHEFGVDEVAYILGLSAASSLSDGRISMDNRFWAIGCNSYFNDADYHKGNGFDISLKSGSPALNKFITRFRVDTDFDPEMVIIGTDKEPYPLDEVYTKSYDYAQENNELTQYLWSWGLNCQCAEVLDTLIADPLADNLSAIQADFGKDRVNFVLASSLSLYANNPIVADSPYKEWADNVPMPENASIVERNDYLMRANADSLVEFLNENLPSLTNEQKDFGEIAGEEEKVLSVTPPKGTYTYGLYQIQNDNCQYHFMPSSAVDHHPDPEDYALVYSGSGDGPFAPASDILEDIYAKFNADDQRPADFKGYSASMSDVIVLNTNDSIMAYYIDSIGFTELPDFVNERLEIVSSKAIEKTDDATKEKKEDTPPDSISMPGGR